MKYKYIRFWFDIGYYTGADDDYVAYRMPVDEAFIENEGEAKFLQFCEDYSYLFMASYDEDNDGDYYENYQDYIDNFCSWGYEEISKEEYLSGIND